MFLECKDYLINLDNVEMIELLFTSIDTPHDNNDDYEQGHLIFSFKTKKVCDVVFDDDVEAVEIYNEILCYLHGKKKLITDERKWE